MHDSTFETIDTERLSAINGGFDFGSIMPIIQAGMQGFQQGGWKGALQAGGQAALSALPALLGGGGGGGAAAGG